MTGGKRSIDAPRPGPSKKNRADTMGPNKKVVDPSRNPIAARRKGGVSLDPEIKLKVIKYIFALAHQLGAKFQCGDFTKDVSIGMAITSIMYSIHHACRQVANGTKSDADIATRRLQ